VTGERVTPVVVACAYALALGVWLLAQTSLALDAGRPVADIASGAAQGLTLVQALVAVLVAPLLSAALAPRAAVKAAVAMLLAALPLVTFVWLTTTVPAARLLLVEAGVLGLALAAVLASALLARWLPAARPRALALATLAAGSAGACWLVHAGVDAWLVA